MEQKQNIQTVILNLIQDLQRLPLSLLKNMRGRFQIKFGMTALFNNGGFTLIELLVVVLIIGILTAVAVPQYQKAVMRNRYATLKNLTKSIAKAQEAYYLANGQYADDFDKLDIALPAGTTSSSATSRYYTWGSCTITANNTLVYCRRNYMGYYMRLSHANAQQNTRMCVVYGDLDETSMRAQVCQMETGSSTVFARSGEDENPYLSYKYAD